jgi:hypothetical protein
VHCPARRRRLVGWPAGWLARCAVAAEACCGSPPASADGAQNQHLGCGVGFAAVHVPADSSSCATRVWLSRQVEASTLLKINRGDFETLLGPCEEFLRRNADTYQKFMKD